MKSKEIPEPVGSYLLDNGKGVMTPTGRYYHYSEVCVLLRKYSSPTEDKLRERVRELEEAVEQILECPCSVVQATVPKERRKCYKDNADLRTQLAEANRKVETAFREGYRWAYKGSKEEFAFDLGPECESGWNRFQAKHPDGGVEGERNNANRQNLWKLSMLHSR